MDSANCYKKRPNTPEQINANVSSRRKIIKPIPMKSKSTKSKSTKSKSTKSKTITLEKLKELNIEVDTFHNNMNSTCFKNELFEKLDELAFINMEQDFEDTTI